MSEAIDIPEQEKSVTTIPEEDYNQINRELTALRAENYSLREIIIQMTAERYLPRENQHA